MKAAGARAVVVYNGDRPNVQTEQLSQAYCQVGWKDSANLAAVLATAADCDSALLFGEQSYGRSYGGASNLVLALGHALDAVYVAKVDDDMLDLPVEGRSWLERAFDSARPGWVYHGRVEGEPSASIHRLPRETAAELGAFFYDSNRVTETMGTSWGGAGLKNGALVFRSTDGASSCFPVLFNPDLNIHVRGEIYWWRDELKTADVSIAPHDLLRITHSPKPGRDPAKWLRSTLVGFEFWSVRAAVKREGRHPSRKEREDSVRRLRSWISATEWPAWTSAADMLEITQVDTLLAFTDRVHAEQRQRRLAWSRLVAANLKSVIRESHPELYEL